MHTAVGIRSSSLVIPVALAAVFAAMPCHGFVPVRSGQVNETGETSVGQVAQNPDVVPSDEIQDMLMRAVVLKPKFNDDGYTTPETSNFISLRTVYFELDSAKLSSSSTCQLDEMAQAYRNVLASTPLNRAPRLLIEGHTCNQGELKHNQELSLLRARSVATYLSARGVDSTLLQSRGWAWERAVAPNNTEENRRLNRRVDFVLRQHQDHVPAAPSTRGTSTTSTASVGYLDVNFLAVADSDGGTVYKNNQIKILNAGDRFRVDLRVLEGCHVYTLLLDSLNDVNWLRLDSPAKTDEWLFAESGVARPGRGLWCYFGEQHCLPNDTEWYVLDANTGTEVLCVIATHGPVANPERLPAIMKQHSLHLTAEIVRDTTGADDAELHILFIEHR